MPRKNGSASSRGGYLVGALLFTPETAGIAIPFAVVILLSMAVDLFPEWKQAGGPIEPQRFGILSIISRGNDLYLGNADGIFRSMDDGRSWKSVAAGLWNCSFRNFALIGNTIYAAMSCGLYAVEIENGEWRTIDEPDPVASYSRQVFSAGNDLFFAANRGVFRSGDRGGTWSPSNSGLDDSSFIRKIIPYTGDRVLAHSSYRLYLSADRGASWNEQNPPATGQALLNMVTTMGDMIVAATEAGLFTTTDPAAGWMDITPHADDTVISCVDIHGSAIIAVASPAFSPRVSLGTVVQKCYLSKDYGNSWETVHQAEVNPSGRYLTIIYLKDSTVLAGATGSGGVLRSTDLGATWDNADSGIVISSIKSCAVIDNTVFAGSWSGLYFSFDNGSSWQKAADTLLKNSGILSIMKLGPAVFAGAYRSLFSTSDIGGSWHSIAIPTDDASNSPGASCFTIADTTILLGMDNGQMYTSIDRGTSWHELATIPGNTGQGITRKIVSMVIDDTVLLAATASMGIFRSIDNGVSWQPANYGLANLYIGALLLVESGLITGTQQGAFLSTDKGLRWRAINAGLPPDLKITALAARGSSVFAATKRYSTDTAVGSIYRFEADSQWSDISGNLSPQTVTSIAFSDSLVFVGTDRRGVYYQPLSEVASIDSPRKRVYCTESRFRLGCIFNRGILTTTVTAWKTSTLSLSLYSLSGKKVASIFNGTMNRGTRCFHSGTGSLSPGIYLMSLKGDNVDEVIKVRLDR